MSEGPRLATLAPAADGYPLPGATVTDGRVTFDLHAAPPTIVRPVARKLRLA